MKENSVVSNRDGIDWRGNQNELVRHYAALLGDDLDIKRDGLGEVVPMPFAEPFAPMLAEPSPAH
jgi:hypothetical protein